MKQHELSFCQFMYIYCHISVFLIETGCFFLLVVKNIELYTIFLSGFFL